MKTFVYALLVLLAAASWSCESRNAAVQEKSANPVEKYGDDAIGAYKGTQQFANQMDVKNLQDAIRSFHSLNGRYPKDLEELGHFAGSNLDGSRYDYDPAAGTIKGKN